MSPTRSELFSAAENFCNAFAKKEDLASILLHFSKSHQVSAIEYGEPCLAPFLGRPFVGIQEVQRYFEQVNSLLSYENVKFSEFVVDTETSQVALKGQGRFTWLSTGESWAETFAYKLDFDDELKVTEYQVWADSGAAYLAKTGRLAEVQQAFIDSLKEKHETGATS